jgi:protein ImuB
MSAPPIRRTARRRAPPKDATGDLFAVAARPRPVAPAAAPVAPAARPTTQPLWLALAFPALPLIAAGRTPAGPPAGPLVIAAGEGAARTVCACNPAAARAGIRPGQKLAAAHAFAAQLTVIEREPPAEACELRRLARWALGFTPCVSLEEPDRLLLEVRGSLTLFGGAAALVTRVAAGLEALGHAPALALAPTARAALWLACAAPGAVVESPAGLAGRLARLPLAATGWSAPVLEDCARLGLDTLGELRRLPRDGLARRFEPGVLAELDEAYGAKPAPRRRYLAPERFRERLELPAELDDLPQLLPYSARLLGRLEHFLRARAAGVSRLTLLLVHRDRRPSCIALGRALPAGDAAGWQSFVRERLSRETLPAPVCALVLRSGAIVTLAGTSCALPGLGQPERAAQAAALLDRLRARLGEGAVSGLGLVPEHRPEAAWRSVAPSAVPPAEAGPRTAALPESARPLWLLATPLPLAAPDGEPRHGGPLALESGPERIESGWWDGAGVARDYYVALTRRGARLWIFRERGARRWFLHGVFG